MRAADAAIIVVDAVAGVEVQTEKAWQVADEFGLPRMFVVNRMDRENADGGRVMDQLQKKFGRSCVCVEAPIGKEKGFRGAIDLIGMKGFLTDDTGKTIEGPIPEEFAADAATLHEALVEMVAEGDDSLMETFFCQGNLTEEQMLPALRNAIRERKIVPVLFAAAGDHERGVEKILDEIVDLLPGADSFPAAAIGQGRQDRRPRVRPERPRRGDRLQDDLRPLHRPPDALPRPLRHGPGRRHLLEREPRGSPSASARSSRRSASR